MNGSQLEEKCLENAEQMFINTLFWVTPLTAQQLHEVYTKWCDLGRLMFIKISAAL